MKLRPTRPTRLLAASAIALCILSPTSGADADVVSTASEYTPSGGPSLELVATNFAIWFEAGQAIGCTDFEVSGAITSPGTARTVGAPAGSVGSLSSACTTDAGAAFAFTSDSWSFEVTGLATGTAWPARFTGVELDWSVGGCQVAMAGDLGGVFDTATQRFMPTSSTITPTSVVGTGCASLGIAPGDTTEFGGYLTNVPPSGSTPLSLS